MEQSPSYEADSHSTDEDNTPRLWHLKGHYHIYKNLPLDSILHQIKQAHTFTALEQWNSHGDDWEWPFYLWADISPSATFHHKKNCTLQSVPLVAVKNCEEELKQKELIQLH